MSPAYILEDLDEMDADSTWVADTLEREAGELLAAYAEFVRRCGD